MWKQLDGAHYAYSTGPGEWPYATVTKRPNGSWHWVISFGPNETGSNWTDCLAEALHAVDAHIDRERRDSLPPEQEMPK